MRQFVKAISGAAILIAAGAANSVAATPEKEAIDTFATFCIVTNANPKAIDKAMEDVVKAKAGGRAPADKLTASTGVKAENAWVMTVGSSRQQLLLTTYKGICALHLNSGDAGTVKKEFMVVAKKFAEAVKSKLTLVEQKKKNKIDFTLYQLGKSGTSPVLGISTSDKAAPSGTKHMLTYTPAAAAKK